MRKHLKIVAFVLCFCLSIAVSIVFSSAEENISSGSCNDSITWEYDSSIRTLTINGSGNMPDYPANKDVPWRSFVSSINTVSVSENITGIGAYSFYGCSSLSDISLPDTLTSIGNYAFTYCSRIEAVSLPEGISGIGAFAFEYCSSLSRINIPASLSSIRNYTFAYCNNLKTIEFPKDSALSIIGEFAFKNCKSLESFSLPDSVTAIYQNAFINCTKLKTFSIGKDSDLSLIQRDAFAGCGSLESFYIPGKLTSIGITNGAAVAPAAFSGCNSLKNIIVSENNTSFVVSDKMLFNYKKNRILKAFSDITEAVIPKEISVLDIGAFAGCKKLQRVSFEGDFSGIVPNELFENCESLERIEIPSGFDKISFRMFLNCINLSEVIISDTVTSIEQYAFSSCSKLVSVEIPQSVSDIGISAFSGCNSLEDLYYRGDESAFSSITVNEKNTELAGCRVHYNAEIKKHLWNESNTATCTEAGLIITACDCGYEKERTGSSALGHTGYVSKSYCAPSYHKKGNTEEISCSLCNLVLQDSNDIDALNYYFSLEDGILKIGGDGTLENTDYFGFEDFCDEIYYAEVKNDITIIPGNMLAELPYLSEVYLEQSIIQIKSGAFTLCPYLSVVTITGNPSIEDGSFDNSSGNLTFVCSEYADNVIQYATLNGINVVTYNYEDNAQLLCFNGTIPVFYNLEYSSINNIIGNYPDTVETYFTKIIFTGTESDLPFDGENLDVEYKNDSTIVNNVFIHFVLIDKDNNESIISYKQLRERLENGDYKTIKVVARNDEKTETDTIATEKPTFIKRIIKLVSKLINFIKKLFTKQ